MTPLYSTLPIEKNAIDCLECHATEGHRIARGLHTTTLMANDLPGVTMFPA